ncbi:hypothetical protein KCP75_07975 [Salmonella enterica subsp. enterica]|nr:hypothetical protein KCP75_07975 [Salmonella enterica subsp. enterica]
MTRSNTADSGNMDNMFSAFLPRKRSAHSTSFSCLSASSTGVTRFSLSHFCLSWRNALSS